jgi:hypothetical protein
LIRILPVIPSAYSLYIRFLTNKLDYLLFQDTCGVNTGEELNLHSIQLKLWNPYHTHARKWHNFIKDLFLTATVELKRNHLPVS